MKTWKKWLADKQVKAQEILKESSAYVLKEFCDRVVYPAFVPLWDRPYGQELKRIHDAIASMQRKTVISVIMPVYCIKVHYLKRAVESVRQQIYPYWELCIADDASKDARITRYLEQVAAEDKRIRVVFREQRGHICAASNTALALATGDYVAMLDHDDQLHPLALFYVARAIEVRPDAEVLYTNEDLLGVWGWRNRYRKAMKSNYYLNMGLFLFFSNIINHLMVLRRKSCLMLGGFRLGYEGGQDYDILRRFSLQFGHNTFVHIPYNLYHWGIVPGSILHSSNAKPYDTIALIRSKTDYTLRKRCSFKSSIFLADILVILRPCTFSTAWDRKFRIQKHFPRISRRKILDLQTIEKRNQVECCLNKIKESSCPYIFWFDVNLCSLVGYENIVSYINHLSLSLNYSQCVGIGGLIMTEKKGAYHAGYALTQLGEISQFLYCATISDLNWFSFVCGSHAIPVSAAGTWCFLARRDIFLEMGGYDTNIEDIETAHLDWCLRCTLQEKREIKIDFNNPCFYPHAFSKPQINQELLRKKYNLDKVAQHVNLHPGLNPPLRKSILPECVWPRHRPWHIDV
jgi:glycosyltransferase involved in cell wall biosynthesis